MGDHVIELGFGNVAEGRVPQVMSECGRLSHLRLNSPKCRGKWSLLGAQLLGEASG